jgi:phenylpropionate dioxygenase-like ring-hydroxylating dioxygenase large terminal subunit
MSATGRYSTARVLDAWYAACRGDDLRDGPIARTIFDLPVVLFRDGAGRARALLDRCAHRNAPLSLGAVDGNGNLACPYHGWRFDGTGACREVPGLLERDTAAGRSVPAFASCEQDGFVWVWARADAEPVGAPMRIPRIDDPDYLVVIREYDVECTMHAALENALDVPHTAFVHRGDFRGKEPREIEAVLRCSQRFLARIGGGKCRVEGRVGVLQISRRIGSSVRRIERLQQRGLRDGEAVHVAVFIGHARDGIAQQLMDPIDRRLQQWTGRAQFDVRDALTPTRAGALDESA